MSFCTKDKRSCKWLPIFFITGGFILVNVTQKHFQTKVVVSN